MNIIKIDVSNNVKDLNYHLQEAVADVVNNSTLKPPYKFIIRSIVYKLIDFCELYTDARFDSANIILRALFEEVVLFEYLLNKPESIEKYILDSEIEEIRLSIEYYNDSWITIEDLKSDYKKLSHTTKKLIEILWSPPITLKDKRPKDERKILAQRTRDLIKELVKIKSVNSDSLKRKQKLYYTNSCKYIHSTFSRIILEKNFSEKERLNKVLHFSSISLDLVNMLLFNIHSYCTNPECIKKCAEEFDKFEDFVKFVETKKENPIVQINKPVE